LEDDGDWLGDEGSEFDCVIVGVGFVGVDVVELGEEVS
jgi:hypothetical protein